MGHWSLRIKSIRDDDRGLYECQLSVHPTQSIFVELQVIGKSEATEKTTTMSLDVATLQKHWLIHENAYHATYSQRHVLS